MLPQISADGKQTTGFKVIDRHGDSIKDSIIGEDTISNPSSEVDYSDFNSDYVPDSHSEETGGSENKFLRLIAPSVFSNFELQKQLSGFTNGQLDRPTRKLC